MEGLEASEGRLLDALRQAARLPLTRGCAQLGVKIFGETEKTAQTYVTLTPSHHDACPLSVCLEDPVELVGSWGRYETRFEFFQRDLQKQVETVTKLVEGIVSGRIEDMGTRPRGGAGRRSIHPRRARRRPVALPI